MAAIVKLLHGADELDINTGRYCIDDATFSPPSTARSITYSRVSVGSEAVRKRRANRAWDFNVTITGSSPAEAERALRELQSFLARSEDDRRPLYIAYRNYNNYTFEAFFGLQGAFMRYEIEHGHAEPGGQYNNTVGNSNAIPNISVRLTIRPQALGIQQLAAQGTGGIFENYIGKANDKVKGTAIGEATTNNFANPALMHATYDTAFTATTSGLVAAENKDEKYVVFGNTSVKLSYSGTAATARFTDSITLTVASYVLSCYVKAQDGSAITSSKVKLWFNGSVTPDLYISQGNGWYRLVYTGTGAEAAQEYGVQIVDNDQAYYADGFQIEQKAAGEVTPFCYGDMLGCTWAGVVNNSTSSRTAALVRYKFADVLPARMGYTVRVVWLPEVAASSASRYLFEDSNDDIGAWIDTSEQINFQVDTGAVATSSPLTITPGTPIVAYFTFDGDTATAYWANASATAIASVASQADNANTAEPSQIYVGSADDTTAHLNGTILGFATFDRAMSSADVSADFAQVRQQVIDDERIDPLPYFYTVGGDDIIDNETDESSVYNYGVIGGLMGDDVDYEIKAISSTVFATTGGLTLGNAPISPRLFNKRSLLLAAIPASFSFLYDGQGTADTAAFNNAYETETVNATEGTIAVAVGDEIGHSHLEGVDEAYAMIVLKEAASGDTLTLRMVSQHGGGLTGYVGSAWRTVSSDTAAYRPYIVGPVPTRLGPPILDVEEQFFGLRVQAKRGTGGTNGDVRVSHAIFFPSLSHVPLDDVENDLEIIWIRGRISELGDSAKTVPTTEATRQMGGALTIKGDRQNLLLVQNAFDNYTGTTNAYDPSYTLDFDQFGFVPRFDIL